MKFNSYIRRKNLIKYKFFSSEIYSYILIQKYKFENVLQNTEERYFANKNDCDKIINANNTIFILNKGNTNSLIDICKIFFSFSCIFF